MFLNEVMEETRKICNSENWPIWATPENLPFFEDEIYPLFSYSYGSKVPKWKCAHNLLCKKYKNCLKLIKIAVLQPPDWIHRKKTPCKYPDTILFKIVEEEIVYALDRHQTVTLLMGGATNADKIEIAGIHSNHIAKMECASTFPH